MSAQAIAEQLNSENVLAPSEYKRLCGLNYHSGFKAGTHAKWQAIQVLRILKNEVYTGTMVQGRRQKINYKIKKIRDVEESGWIRVPNMHEAIIPQKLFDTVQEVLKLDTCASKGQQTVNKKNARINHRQHSGKSRGVCKFMRDLLFYDFNVKI